MKLLNLFKSRKKTQKITPDIIQNKSENNGRKVFEKILMGAVIGGAIGSVIGASIKKKTDNTLPKKRKFALLRKILGLKKKIPIETDKKDL